MVERTSNSEVLLLYLVKLWIAILICKKLVAILTNVQHTVYTYSMQMSPESVFPRITLIKELNEDCVTDLRHQVGLYTHIQSINGCFLDGYSVRNISAIFQLETKKENVQLMVRFIHSRSDNKPTLPSPLSESGKDSFVVIYCTLYVIKKTYRISLSSTRTLNSIPIW